MEMYKDVEDPTGGCHVFWEATSRSWSHPVTAESSNARFGKVGAPKPDDSDEQNSSGFGWTCLGIVWLRLTGVWFGVV
jgi:hypothetical protein